MQRIACFDVLVLMHVYVRDTPAGTSGNDSWETSFDYTRASEDEPLPRGFGE